VAYSTAERARVERVTRSLANPVYFHEQYIRPYDPAATSAIPMFARDMLSFALRNKKAVVMLPPEFMKTTVLSQTLPLWLTFVHTAEGRMLRGMLMSEEEDMAKGNLATIKWHVENNERLLTDFVDKQGRPVVRQSSSQPLWTETQIIVARPGTSKDPTWQAKGLDSKGVHGRRLDWFIGDDVVTPRNAGSPALRKQALEKIELEVETRLVRDAHMLICSNFHDTKDLSHTLAGRDDFAMMRRVAIHKPGRPDTPPNERDLTNPAKSVLLWPENWDRERLLRIHRATPQRFRRIYLMDPRAEYGERLNVNLVTMVAPDETPLTYAKFYLGIDPAVGGEGDDLDFFNISVGALHGLNLDLIESHDSRAGHQGAALLGAIHDRYQRVGSGVIAIGVSRQVLDRMFENMVKVVRPDLVPKLVPVSIPGDKESRLEGLGVFAQSGWLRIWESVWNRQTSGPMDRHQEVTLYEQWRDFPFASHDDKLDGLDVLIRTTQEFAMVGSTITHALTALD
jgi:hypothetical protein